MRKCSYLLVGGVHDGLPSCHCDIGGRDGDVNLQGNTLCGAGVEHSGTHKLDSFLQLGGHWPGVQDHMAQLQLAGIVKHIHVDPGHRSDLESWREGTVLPRHTVKLKVMEQPTSLVCFLVRPLLQEDSRTLSKRVVIHILRNRTHFFMTASVAPRMTKQSLAERGRSCIGMSNSRISFHSAFSAGAPREVVTVRQSGSVPW